MKTFESIISPVSATEFLKNNWCKAPLFLARNDEAVNNILTLDDIGALLDSSALIYPYLRMVGGGKELERELYVNNTTSMMQTIDRSKVLDLFNKGNTIVLQSPNLYFPQLDKFIADVSQEFGMRAHANVYITPANSKGFDPHVDAHEVFVLQVYGTKEWNLYDIPYVSPTKSIMLTSEDKERYKQPPAHAIQLQQGDVLYVPCGLVHDAYTTDMPSIHITLGLHPLRRVDLLEKVVKEAEQQAFFRQPCFPVGDEFERAESFKMLVNETVKLLSNIIKTSDSERETNKGQKRYEGVFKDIIAIDSVTTLEDINALLQNPVNKVEELIDAIEPAQSLDNHVEAIGKIKFKLKDLVKQGSIKVER